MLERIDRLQLWLFGGFALATLVSILCAIALREVTILAIPFVLIGAYITLVDFKKIFYLLLFVLPLSTEVTLGSFGTDLPSEPLMWVLMFAFGLFILAKPKFLSFKFLKHPIILLLLLHFAWMCFIIMFSEKPMVSTKFVLAKTWYIVTFVFMAGIILTRKSELKKYFWFLFLPLTFTVIQTLVRYSFKHFDFEFVNPPLYPFFRNHVNYAAMITIFYPFIWLAADWYERGSFKRNVLQAAKVLYLVAIYFSYTRACYLALGLAAVGYILMNRRLLTVAFSGALVCGVVAVLYMVHYNKYLKLAPDYVETIYHDNFSDHLKATVELQDVSSMERVYRWVAAFRMVEKHPITGYGTGNFYPYYQQYTVTEFITYTSDNEERSTVHDYFFLTMVEQGFPGLILFIIFSVAIFYYGEKGYRAETDPDKKRTILIVVLSLLIVYVNLTLSDLVEVDKTGSLYFMGIALLVNLLTGNYDNKEEEVKAIA